MNLEWTKCALAARVVITCLAHHNSPISIESPPNSTRRIHRYRLRSTRAHLVSLGVLLNSVRPECFEIRLIVSFMLQSSCSVNERARCCSGAFAVWISVIPCFSTNYTPTQPSRSPPTLRLLSMTSNFMSQVRALPRMVTVFIRSLYFSCMCSFKSHFALRQSTDLRPPWAPRVKSLFVSYALRGSYSATAHVHSCSGTCAWHNLSIPFLPTLCRPIDTVQRSIDSALSLYHVHPSVSGTIVNTPCR